MRDELGGFRRELATIPGAPERVLIAGLPTTIGESMRTFTRKEVHDQLNILITMTREIPPDQPIKTHPDWQAQVDLTKVMVSNCPEMEQESWRYIQTILYAIGVDASQVH